MRTKRFTSSAIALLLAAGSTVALAQAPTPTPAQPKGEPKAPPPPSTPIPPGEAVRPATPSKPGALNISMIEQHVGYRGRYFEREQTYRIDVPRREMQLQVAGAKIAAPMATGLWASFKPVGNRVFVAGDLTLTEAQVNPVLGVLIDNGLNVDSLYSAYLFEEPALMHLSFSGMGQEEVMSAAVGKVFGQVLQGSLTPSPRYEIDTTRSTLDANRVQRMVGREGETADNVYRVWVPYRTRWNNAEVAGLFGVHTWASISGANDKALMIGEIATTREDLREVLRSLRANRVDVNSIHSRSTTMNPPILFVRVTGVGAADHLAMSLKGALDAASTGRMASSATGH